MSQEARWARWATAGGALLAALGWWLPWVLPTSGAAALALLGLDLGEFWKFTAEWRGGLLEGERVTFFLPPTLAAMILALWVAAGRGARRWLLMPLLLFLSVVILPPLQEITPSRQFRFQLLLSGATLLVIALIPAWQRLGGTVRRLVTASLALAGALLPAWAMWYTWLLLQGLYGGSARVGPGIFLSCGGFLVVALAALLPASRNHD